LAEVLRCLKLGGVTIPLSFLYEDLEEREPEKY